MILEMAETPEKDDSGNTDKPDDKPEETKILTGEAEVASNEYGSVSGTYQVKVKVTVDKDGNIISVEDDGTEPGKKKFIILGRCSGVI